MNRACPSRSLAVLLAVAVLATASAARGGDAPPAVESVSIPTERGVKLEAALHRPAKPNGCAVVVAPGQGGGRERPVTKKAAEALAAAGFTVVRFDWAFFTAKSNPSEGFETEAADLEAAIAFTRARPGVEKILVAGKSLGTLATAVRLGTKSDDLAGLLMLTPALAVGGPAGSLFPGVERLFDAKIPTLMVSGDHDPLCPLATLYDLASKSDSPPRIVVVPGDHGLSKARGDDSETDENVALSTAAVVLWARRFTGR